MTIVKSRIIKIGNSQGLRIPKVVLEQLNMHDEVELEVKEKQLVVRAITGVRQNWAAKFEEMAARRDDKLLDEEVISLSSWDDEEWEW